MVVKHNVIVEDKNVHKQDEELEYNCQKVTYEATSIILIEVIVQFENISIVILTRKIHNCNEKEVKGRKETVPVECFANTFWET